jgi:hypothetical protein
MFKNKDIDNTELMAKRPAYWDDEELNAICENCGEIFGYHSWLRCPLPDKDGFEGDDE